MKVLCVDDEERVRVLLSNLLEINEFEAICASNGEQALELFLEIHPDIVITDVRMPKMDGIELLKQIKETDYDAEVIVISAHSDIDNAIASLRFGAANFVRKPIDARELTHILNQHKERIQLRRELEHYRENLENLVDEKTKQLVDAERYAVLGRHSAHLAHNLNSSLTGILGCIQLLDIKLPERTEQIDKYIQTIQDSAIKMKDTIGNTLIRARKSHNLSVTELNINEIIASQIKLFQTHSVVNKEVEFKTEFTETLPLLQGVYSDFTQVLDNLISNAIDALEFQKEKQIVFSTYFDNKTLTFEVADNGCGIPPNIQNQIFNPHFTTKEVGKGTGIGLASVKELLENYKSKIFVESSPETGTTFKIQIPRTDL